MDKDTISIQQPWAWLILNHGKDIENRSEWSYKHRGRVLIHAGLVVDKDISQFPAQNGLSSFRNVRELIEYLGIAIPDDLPTGAIVGEVTITGVVTDSDSPWFEGQGVGITLEDPLAYDTPIPYRGELGIFKANI